MKYFFAICAMVLSFFSYGIAMPSQALGQDLNGTTFKDQLSQQESNNTPHQSEKQQNFSSKLPSYSLQVIAKKTNDFIAIFCVLDKPFDKYTLRRLGIDCYKKVNGQDYKKVHINWYIKGTPKNEKPWGVTNFSDEGIQVAIF